MIRRLCKALESVEELLENSQPKHKYTQPISAGEIDAWLISEKNYSFVFDYGSADLGSAWRGEIPITPLLIAGLATGKVEIKAKYDHERLVGGIHFVLSKNEPVTNNDLDGLIITRAQYDYHMRKEYERSKK